MARRAPLYLVGISSPAASRPARILAHFQSTGLPNGAGSRRTVSSRAQSPRMKSFASSASRDLRSVIPPGESCFMRIFVGLAPGPARMRATAGRPYELLIVQMKIFHRVADRHLPYFVFTRSREVFGDDFARIRPVGFEMREVARPHHAVHAHLVARDAHADR